jgi:hypothetical protein
MMGLAIVLVVAAIKVFMDHRSAEYQGPYNKTGSYESVSAVKHDMFKDFAVGFFVLLVYGLSSGTKLWDMENMMDSWIGMKLVSVTGFFVFHELVQPYLLTRLPNF